MWKKLYNYYLSFKERQIQISIKIRYPYNRMK